MLYEKLVKQGTKVPYLPFSDFGLNKGLYSLFQSPLFEASIFVEKVLTIRPGKSGSIVAIEVIFDFFTVTVCEQKSDLKIQFRK